MPIVTVAAAAFGTVTAIGFLGPRFAAECVVRVCRRILSDRALLEEAGRVASQAARSADSELAEILWSAPMQRGLQEAIVGLFMRPDFVEAFTLAIMSVTKDRSLKDTIREGVLEALHDGELRAEVKAVVIEGLSDQDMRSALLRAAISTVKTGIREAVDDNELKEVLAAAIRDALEDPKLNSVLRNALKDALADQELHRATLQGAVSALNPFKKTSATLAPTSGPTTCPAGSDEASASASRSHSPPRLGGGSGISGGPSLGSLLTPPAVAWSSAARSRQQVLPREVRC